MHALNMEIRPASVNCWSKVKITSNIFIHPFEMVWSGLIHLYPQSDINIKHKKQLLLSGPRHVFFSRLGSPTQEIKQSSWKRCPHGIDLAFEPAPVMREELRIHIMSWRNKNQKSNTHVAISFSLAGNFGILEVSWFNMYTIFLANSISNGWIILWVCQQLHARVQNYSYSGKLGKTMSQSKSLCQFSIGSPLVIRNIIYIYIVYMCMLRQCAPGKRVQQLASLNCEKNDPCSLNQKV